MKVEDLFPDATRWVDGLIRNVADDQWELPTPCDEWSVRDLVQHLVYEDRWAPPLLSGATIEQVGDRFEGDLLGDDPVRAWTEAQRDAVQAVRTPGVLERGVHLSFGETPGAEYVWQLTADHLVHGWDLARATGQPDRADPELVQAVSTWFIGMEPMYREGGAIGDPVPVADDADEQDQLLGRFGRSPNWPDR